MPLSAAAVERAGDTQHERGTLAGVFPAQASGTEGPAQSESPAERLLTHFPKEQEYEKAEAQCPRHGDLPTTHGDSYET